MSSTAINYSMVCLFETLFWRENRMSVRRAGACGATKSTVRSSMRIHFARVVREAFSFAHRRFVECRFGDGRYAGGGADATAFDAAERREGVVEPCDSHPLDQRAARRGLSPRPRRFLDL